MMGYSKEYRPGTRSFGPLPDHLRQPLNAVIPTRDGAIEYRPCRRTSPRRRAKGVIRDAERWLLLWCNPLRNCGHTLSRNELSLLNLPSNYRLTVRSLVQRAPIRLPGRPGRSYSVQINAEGDAQFLSALWHAAHFRARRRLGRTRRYDMRSR